MKERLFKRDLPLLQASGLRAKNTLAGIVSRRIDRPTKQECKSFDGGRVDPKAFPVLQGDITAGYRRPRVGSQSFSRENSNSEPKALTLKRDRSGGNTHQSSRASEQIRKPSVLNNLKSFSERRTDLAKTHESIGQETSSRAYALISNHVGRTSKNSIAKPKSTSFDYGQQSHTASLNTSFKLTGSSRSYRSPKTPYIAKHSTGSGLISAKESRRSSKKEIDLQIKTDDIKISPSMPSTTDTMVSKPASAKIVGKSSSKHEMTIGNTSFASQNQSAIKKHDTMPTSNNKESNSALRQSSAKKSHQPSSAAKPDSKLSLKMMMSPPLIVFGGQNAVRLDPLLTRKSATASDDILAYAAGTHNGIIRNYNEDRLAIVLNYKLKSKNGDPVICNFFGIYDGHGGVSVADYLKNNLHKQAFAMEEFLNKPTDCIKKSCKKCEDLVLEQCYSKRPIDRAGACGLFSFIFQKRILVGNVGDSRAILSRQGGQIKQGITNDHKPDDPTETERIKRHGGHVYRTAAPKLDGETDPNLGEIKLPWRVMPGRLSVSRTFGDIAAKYKELEGIPGVISAEPDIFEIPLTEDLDFVILACDGVFDRLENDYIIDLVWAEVMKHTFPDIHTACEYMIHLIFRHSVQKLSYDNISIIFLAFKGFSDRLSLSKDSSS